MYYLWSADLSKSFLNWLRQYLLSSINSFCQHLSFNNIFFNRFSPVQKCGVTSHWLYREALTLICLLKECTFWKTLRRVTVQEPYLLKLNAMLTTHSLERCYKRAPLLRFSREFIEIFQNRIFKTFLKKHPSCDFWLTCWACSK